MGTATARLKQERTQVLPRRASVAKTKPVVQSRNSAKNSSRQSSVTSKPETVAKKPVKLTANGRTPLAESYGRMVRTILRFTKKHEIPPSLKRRLETCAGEIWDLEIEEDGKHADWTDNELVKMGERALQAHKEGKTVPLTVALKALKERGR